MNNKYTFIGINTEEEINIYDKNDKLYFTCTDSYDGATIELTKDKAIELANKYDLKIPIYIIDSYQNYIFRELDKDLRRGGTNYLSKEYLTLKSL